jgi:hypothetical protein
MKNIELERLNHVLDLVSKKTMGLLKSIEIMKSGHY